MRIILAPVLLFVALSANCQLSFVNHHYNIPNNAMVNHAATGDFNGDGKPDVITAGNYAGDAASQYFFIFMSNAADSLDTAAVLIPYQHPDVMTYGVQAMAVADMNHDNLDDIVIGTYDSVYVYYQQPNHTFVLSPGSKWGETEIQVIRIADIDHDGNNDIVIGTIIDNALSIAYGTAVTGSFTTVDYPAVTQGVQDLIVGKLGRDTNLTIVSMPDFAGNGTAIEAIKINNNRQLTSVTGLHVPPSFSSFLNGIALGDIYGTGNNEMVVCEILDTVVYFNHPDIDSIADSSSGPAIIGNAESVLIANLECNGQGQIVLAGPGNSISVIENNGNITSFDVSVPNNLDYDDMIATNVLGDAMPDIVIANTDGVTILQNTSSGYASSVVGTDTIASDTTHTQTSFNTTTLTDTVYAHNDTLVLLNQSVKIYYNYIDTNVTVATTTRRINRCFSDTTFVIDTASGLLSRTYYQDTIVLSSTYDTVFITGIQKLNEYDINIYPNPFTSGINVQGVDENALVQLYNLAGELIISQHCAGNCYIPRSSLSQGIYILKIVNTNASFYRKLTAF